MAAVLVAVAIADAAAVVVVPEAAATTAVQTLHFATTLIHRVAVVKVVAAAPGITLLFLFVNLEETAVEAKAAAAIEDVVGTTETAVAVEAAALAGAAMAVAGPAAMVEAAMVAIAVAVRVVAVKLRVTARMRRLADSSGEFHLLYPTILILIKLQRTRPKPGTRRCHHCTRESSCLGAVEGAGKGSEAERFH